jgi:hypothetical protein
MMKRASTRWWISALLALWTLPLLSGGGAETAGVEEQARAALKPLKQQLMGELTRALGESPVTAIEVCRVRAPEIADALAESGPRVGRTSHRLRNPENAPADWVEPLLEAYVDDPTNLEPRSVAIDERTAGYVEPIKVQKMCLACHGTEIDPVLAEKIIELYPEDQATGFRSGDFRGLFWVEVPLDDPAKAR